MFILLALSSALNFTENGTFRITATLHSKQCTQYMQMMLCTLPTVHFVHSTCAMQMVLCTLPTVHCTQYIYNVDGALYQLYTLYAVHVQYLYNVDGALYSSNCTLCTRYMYNVDGALYRVPFQLYTLQTVHVLCRWGTYPTTEHSEPVHSTYPMQMVHCTLPTNCTLCTQQNEQRIFYNVDCRRSINQKQTVNNAYFHA